LTKDQNKRGSYLSITLLILSGELIFMLPYVLARIFRPTFLDVFNLTNLELGSLFSIYGIVALLSYVYGGVVSDKYQPKNLITISLFLTSFGGLVMATYPSYLIMQILYGYWGFTTIFLFWGSMIKATRVWGGTEYQGKAFGFLDGGRGLVAASFGTIGVVIFSLFLTSDIKSATLEERKEAFRYVIIFSSAIIFITGLLVHYLMDSDDSKQQNESTKKISTKDIKEVLKIKSVWLIMLIIISAYMGYKVTDIYSLYASDVMMFDQLESANIGSLQLYLRPLVCFAISFIALKSKYIDFIIVGFIVMLIGSLLFASGLIKTNMNLIFYFSLIIVATGTYAIRSLYFSIMQEGKIPLIYTGTAVGIISVIGYTPDIFATPGFGYLLDKYPGIYGHQLVFLILAIFSVLGLISSIMFKRLKKSII
tara:strand:- start:2763 stop:4031 length:1269 start_codon:yes stop_codon:yes gene_type:complete